ncbi:hypothetical protein CEXT_501131 [Caerostris extrusa]|uniref:Uncharacterized protein n=1 Tax=Caerostris extrusa TaxID=172846 RepID=A0AAV4NCB6_CAEEX|nr:hypothetical protein CEXT_501131 [Caerostris extrusa]
MQTLTYKETVLFAFLVGVSVITITNVFFSTYDIQNIFECRMKEKRFAAKVNNGRKWKRSLNAGVNLTFKKKTVTKGFNQNLVIND